MGIVTRAGRKEVLPAPRPFPSRAQRKITLRMTELLKELLRTLEPLMTEQDFAQFFIMAALLGIAIWRK